MTALTAGCVDTQLWELKGRRSLWKNREELILSRLLGNGPKANTHMHERTDEHMQDKEEAS